MLLKYFALIIAFVILPNIVSATNQFAITTISDLEKSEMNQKIESPRSNIETSADKLKINEISKNSNSNTTAKRIFIFIVVAGLTALTIKLIL